MGSAEFSEASILSDLKCQSSKSVDRGCQAHLYCGPHTAHLDLKSFGPVKLPPFLSM